MSQQQTIIGRLLKIQSQQVANNTDSAAGRLEMKKQKRLETLMHF